MSDHAINGRIGALESWSRTPDRRARTAPAHSKSPASLEYWLAKVNTVEYWLAKVDPDGEMTPEGRRKAAGAAHRQMTTDDRRKAAENAHRAHMLRLAKASARARAKRRST